MKKQKQYKIGGIVIGALVVLMALFVGVRTFFIDWYSISGGSMNPTYQDGQVVFAHKIGQAQRFDVVIIKSKDLVGEELIIKRVIAFEGEQVWSQNGVLFVMSNGQEQSFDVEDYGGGQLEKLPHAIKKQTVPQGCVYVLGDNRLDSIDSRTFGAVSVDLIEAVVF